MYSFLSPQNINWLIFKLRSTYPEDKYESIRQETPALANEWFRTRARINEEQFVYGTNALNSAFLDWITTTRRFMAPLPDPQFSYTGDIRDPYIRNQQFENVSNDMIYPSEAFEYDIGQAEYFRDIYAEFGDSKCGGVPILNNMSRSDVAAMATQLKRRRDGKCGRNVFKAQLVTCEGDSRSAELPLNPRKRFMLTPEYNTMESNTSELYWANISACRPVSGSKSAAILRENTLWYPNARYPHKDMIPTKKRLLPEPY